MSLAYKIKRRLLQLIRGDALTVEQLRKKGLTIGKNVDIYTSAIDLQHGYLIFIGNNVTVASGTRLITHDASTKKILGYSKIGRIEIGNDVFIGAGSIVLPNVRIGDRVIIGAGSVVVKDIPNDSIAVGNPCQVIGDYQEFVAKNRELLNKCPKQTTNSVEKSEFERFEMQQAIRNGGWGFDE